MASLKLEHIYKVYPNGHKAVSDFNMNIEDGEFIVFVGPSGCGKSTTLRMIAGLEEISTGELYIGDTLVNDMQPKDRDIAMVFQNYALYPHMTVYENMAFGLTLRKVPRTEIHEKVMWAADVLGLKEYLDRKPKAMSGGQRQRVSLGRAILRNPKVMLLDEPLSNLDAKLRGQMRSMISKLHQSLKTTFIYVTHDQVEAMTLGTRVVVMKLGRIQQVDTPQNLYDHPINKFVAGFIGTPQMNFFNVTLKEEKDHVAILWKDCEQPALKISHDAVLKAERKYLKGDIDVTLGFRCEAVSAEDINPKDDNVVDVIVSHFEELGNETLIYGDLKEVEGLGGESSTGIIIKAPSKMGHVPGDVIKAKIDVERIHLFDSQSEMTIIPPIPEENVMPINIIDGQMDLFGKEKKPESIPVEIVKDGFIALPLAAMVQDEKGSVEGKVLLLEDHGEHGLLAMIQIADKKLFAFVKEGTKVGDKVKFLVDYSKATFRDAENKTIALPLPERDNLKSTFVNLKTAHEVTQDDNFLKIQEERVNKVEEEYKQKFEEFNKEKEAALAEAKAKQDAAQAGLSQKQAEMNQKNSELNAELKEASAKHKEELKEIKARHAKIEKEEMAKIDAMYKKMWEDEVADYKRAMANNKDYESRKARKLSFQVFKESFPQMKANDVERKTNSLEFDKETEVNGAKARFAQKKNLLKETIKENKSNFEKENYPLKVAEAEYQAKEAELNKKKEHDVLHAKLIFFFKQDNFYQIIPDDITAKIIQGLGNRVFTKVFRIEVPHDGFVEEEGALEFQVVSNVNYGDAKMYKCSGEMYGEKVTVFIKKEREIEVGSKIYLRPKLEETQIYEDELNIRLY